MGNVGNAILHFVDPENKFTRYTKVHIIGEEEFYIDLFRLLST